MNNTKKSIVIILIAAVAGFLFGFCAYTLFNLGELIAPASLFATFIGKSAGAFSMKSCLLFVLVTLFAVPSVRREFSGSYSAGRDYQKSNKGKSSHI